MDSTTIIIDLAGIIISALISFIVASIKIGVYKNKVDTLETEVKQLREDIKNVSTELTKCSTKIDERTRSYSSTLTKVESPIALSDKGKELLSQSEADKFVLENQADLVEKIKLRNPHSAYDVQEYANQVVKEIQNEPKFKKFKDFAYNRGLPLDPIFIVMGIYLRDIALPILGYKLEEIKDEVNVVQKNADNGRK